MADSSHYIFSHICARKLAAAACMTMPDGWHCRITPPTRSLEQNALLWSMLADVSSQVIWHGRMLDAESWKHIFSAGMKKMDVVPNLDGTGFVVLGLSTSKMSVKEISDMIELINSFGVERGILFKSD